MNIQILNLQGIRLRLETMEEHLLAVQLFPADHMEQSAEYNQPKTHKNLTFFWLYTTLILSSKFSYLYLTKPVRPGY